MLLFFPIFSTNNKILALEQLIDQNIKNGIIEADKLSAKLNQFVKITESCATYIVLRFEDEMIKCYNLMKEYNLMVDKIIDNYYNNNESPFKEEPFERLYSKQLKKILNLLI